MTAEPGGDWVPRPDPTLLTTQQLLRELAALRELIETRLDGMDRATELLSATVNRTPTVIQTEISHVRELLDQKFTGVEQRFAERDTRFNQQNEANAAALAAALQSARELGDLQTKANALANAKTEESVAQQLHALTEKIDVNTQRLDRGEGSTSGAAESRSERRLDTGSLIQLVGLLVAIGVALFAVIHG